VVQSEGHGHSESARRNVADRIKLPLGLQAFDRLARDGRQQHVAEAVLHDANRCSSNATVRSRFAVARFGGVIGIARANSRLGPAFGIAEQHDAEPVDPLDWLAQPTDASLRTLAIGRVAGS
jgi:hypothetical protein